MRKIFALFICAALLICLLPAVALAADTTPADGYNDHDYDAIRAFLETEVGGVKNGTLVNSGYNADDPTTWSVSWEDHSGESYVRLISWDSTGIQGALSLTGFSYLDAAYVSNNSLTSLDVSGCTELYYLSCGYNSALSSINLSGDTALETLACAKANITSLDVSTAGTSLLYLYCYDNQIDTLNISANTSLKRLQCHNNALTSLSVSGFTALWELYCSGNNLASLNIAGCTALTMLDCSHNTLDTLDVSTNTALMFLYCHHNQLTALSASNHTALLELYCDENQLATLDVSGCTVLDELYCYTNALDELDVSDNTALTDLICYENNLTALDLSQNAILEQLDCEINALESLDLSYNTELYYLNCGYNSITALDVSHNTKLEYLYCYFNDLTELDASMCTLIEYFACAYCPVTQIDVNTYGSDISLTAGEGGYVALVVDWVYGISAGALSVDPAAFYDWTDAADVQFSTTAVTDLDWGTDYDLTANFLSLSPSVADGKIYTGGRITLTPSIAGGTWSFDTASLSRSGNQFTGLQAGTVRVTYTLNNVSTYFDVVIEQSQLPSTGQDFTWVYVAAVGAALVLAAALTFRKRAARN